MRRSLLAVLITTASLALSGCAGEAARVAAGPASSAPASSGTDSPTSAASPSEDPAASGSASASAGTAAATGPELPLETAVINSPEGWFDGVRIFLDGATTVGPDNDVRYTMTFNQQRVISVQQDLEGLVAEALEFGAFEGEPERLPEVDMGGNPAYHLGGKDENLGLNLDEYGFSTFQQAYRLTVNTPNKLSRAERDALIAPVLASFRFTG